MLKPRHQKLLEELPKNGYKVKPSAIKAGYSEQYADKMPKQLLKAALKAQAKDVIATLEDKPIKEMKKNMNELIGLSREDMFNTLKKIATNDRDYASALKILAPLAKEHGLLLQEEEAKVVVPILNIGVRQADTPLIDGSTEPYDPTTTDNIDCATLE